MFNFFHNWIFSVIATSILYRLLTKKLNMKLIKFKNLKDLKTDEDKRDIFISIILYTNILILTALITFTFTYYIPI